MFSLAANSTIAGLKEGEVRNPARCMVDEYIPIARRPRTVVVVSVFLFLAAAVALVIAASLLFPNPFWNRTWDFNRPACLAFKKLGKLPGVLLLALGMTTSLAGVGLLRRKKWLGGSPWQYSQSMAWETWSPYF